MKLPRWTVYPALGLILTLIVTALPHAGDSPAHSGSAKRARENEQRRLETIELEEAQAATRLEAQEHNGEN